MKRLLFLIFLACSSALIVKAQAPAFPGAEGFGRYTTGGRGGAVYHVTSLADDGSEGTFRWACQKSGARTIVFDVSGTINLTSQLKLNKGDVTIAGQTAPGDGICIADYPFVISANNVIIRYVRFRLGNRNVASHEGDGLGGMDKKNIIIDHCSVSWSIDECLSVYGCHDFTVQWCIAAQSLVNSGHSKGDHGYGGNWGGSGASYHHNLIAHNTSRTPRLGPRPGTQTDERMDMRNNVIYNWAGEGCYGGEGMNVNIVNNYYKPGPATLKVNSAKQKRIASIGIRTSKYTKHDTSSPNDWDKMWHVWGKFYVDGNVNTDNDDVTNDNWTYGIYNQITNSNVDNTFTQETKDTMKLTSPIAFGEVTTHTAANAYKQVLDYVGCSLSRDALDATICSDVRDGIATYTGGKTAKGAALAPGFINSQDDCGGWPTLNPTEAPLDSDGDGMPDAWENANGLNPNDAADAALYTIDSEKQYYPNLEVYINSLVQDIMVGENGDAIEAVKEYFPAYTKEDGTKVEAINGYATSIASIADEGTIASTTYYNLQGVKVTNPSKGLYVKVSKTTNGNTINQKTIIK